MVSHTHSIISHAHGIGAKGGGLFRSAQAGTIDGQGEFKDMWYMNIMILSYV